jgi:hypothetical protein
MPAATDVPADLVSRLADAAAAAVRNERPSLSYQPERLRSITVELELDRAGAIIDGRAFVERQVRPVRGSGATG